MLKKITLRSCVEFAVNTEAELSEYYKHLAVQWSEDKEISSLFHTFAKDEEGHKEQFEKLLEQISDSETGLSAEGNDFLTAMCLSKAFEKLYGRYDFVYIKDDRKKLLFELYEFEKATLGFYTALMEIMEDQMILRKIVSCEKKHVVSVMEMVAPGSKYLNANNNWP